MIFSKNTRYYIGRYINEQIRRARYVYLRLFPQHGVLPDFLIIGAAKCGTTSLYDYLGHHSHVRLATKKEIGFFRSGRATAELTRYKAHFPPASGTRDWITGEAYPSYIFDPAAPRNIHEALPDVRMILLMRNPIDRAYSNFQDNRSKKFEPVEVFEDALALEAERLDPVVERMKKDPTFYDRAFHRFSYVRKGQYAEQIERWLEYFPREQFLFASSEEFFADTSGMLVKIHQFLGLAPQTLDRYEIAGSTKYDPIAPETRRRLMEHFRPHNQRLYKLLGTDYGWDH